MKTSYLVVIFLLLNIQFYGQTITGKVISVSNNEPLIYASIGVIETTIGTITDEEGNFNLDIKDLPGNSKVRFSMVGFKSKTFTLEELSIQSNLLQLESEIYNLPEIIILPAMKAKNVGTTGYTPGGGICGWGGSQTGKGWEIGTKIELGDLPVKLKTLHIRVNKNSYDSTLFRLHVRKIVDNMPLNELLNNNVLISLSNKTGWVEIDLSKYNLIFDGDVALSLEWIKIIGMDPKKFITAGADKQPVPGVTLNIKRNRGCLFTKWGIEAKWVRLDLGSPCIYLTVQ